MLRAYFKTPEEAEAFASGVYLAENLEKDPTLVVHDMILDPDCEKPYVVTVKDKSDASNEEKSVDLNVFPAQPEWCQ